MGYFSNGAEGEDYWETYCVSCIHDSDNNCPVWLAHLLHNYSEVNKPDSILNVLIPRDKNGQNQKCAMYYEQR